MTGMHERDIPEDRNVVHERPGQGGGAATPSFGLPTDAGMGIRTASETLQAGPLRLAWGVRTYVMGVLNVTPDSFSGDGLLAPDATGALDAALDAALDQARRMVADGADLLDVGGASSRPGHAPVAPRDETARVVPVIRAIRASLPGTALSIDTTSTTVASAALDAGAHILNDIWGVSEDPAMVRLAAQRGVPIVLMHNRAEARYRNVVAEVVADLQRALDRALDAGVPWDHLVVDPGFGFGKTPDHNLAILEHLDALRVLGRPILLGTSRKSTLGKLLDLPPDQRVEATAATTALGIAAGADIVRVHDVRENVRTARVADAILRGWRPDGWPAGG
jgi:dihydropteroate synthase